MFYAWTYSVRVPLNRSWFMRTSSQMTNIRASVRKGSIVTVDAHSIPVHAHSMLEQPCAVPSPSTYKPCYWNTLGVRAAWAKLSLVFGRVRFSPLLLTAYLNFHCYTSWIKLYFLNKVIHRMLRILYWLTLCTYRPKMAASATCS